MDILGGRMGLRKVILPLPLLLYDLGQINLSKPKKKKIGKQDLLYSTGKYIKYLVVTYIGKQSEK